MGYFDVNFNGMIPRLLPLRLRGLILVAWLRCLTAPVRYVYGLFSANRSANVYLLTHNSQVFSIQTVLNDTFDYELRRIVLVDIYSDYTLYLAKDSEIGYTSYQAPAYLAQEAEYGATDYDAPVYLYTDEEIAAAVYDFIVRIPSSLVYDNARLTALVNRYRLPTKNNWIVVTF